MSNPYVDFKTSVLDANTKVVTFGDDYKLEFGVVIGLEIILDSIKKKKLLQYKIQLEETKQVILRPSWVVGISIDNLTQNLKNSLTKI